MTATQELAADAGTATTEEPGSRGSLRSRLRSRPPRGERKPLSSGLLSTVWVLTAVCALTVWVLAFALGLSGLQEHRSQTLLYQDLREQLAEATAPIGGAVPVGAPVALLDAPQGGLHHVVVVEGTTAGQLSRGPGHLASTVLPGQDGVSVLMGRSATFGHPFGAITSLRPGDTVTATTGQGAFTYRVDRVRYPGDRVPAPPAAGHSQLTLVTSYATGWRGGWAPHGTVYVDATLVGKTQPAPPGRPDAVVEAALPMKGEPAALVPLLLLLQALVAVAVGIVWGVRRWGGVKTWLVGFPLGLAFLWVATQTAMLLLPNLI